MRTKKTLFYSTAILAVSALLMFVKADVSWAESMTLKVSHQFAAGDVRDQMGRVFGEMVTKRTNGEIKFRHYPAKSLSLLVSVSGRNWPYGCRIR
jgi:TRAP-type C4-dicarboxylate transport system substrate-binding protein